MRDRTLSRVFIIVGALLALPVAGLAGDSPIRPTQEQIASGDLSLREIRLAGLRMFSTRFTVEDGFGDGPLNVGDTVAPGGRPSLQGNGSLLRINGLDGQSCIECHSVVRADTVPPTFGVGGVGGSVSNAIIQPRNVDPIDRDLDGTAGFDGRFANPPFVFGAGGVELIGLEMTEDLQQAQQRALDNPGLPVRLLSKGVDFGVIVAGLDGSLDTSDVQGVAEDLVVRPFGRKGEFATVRAFDIEAMQFHFGLQPVEVVGAGQDADGDGMVDEISVGDLSALSAFVTTMEPPVMEPLDDAGRRGFERFEEIGCASCHVPTLNTRQALLPLRFPEITTDPASNRYASIDLREAPMRFRQTQAGGLEIPLFADLKRHDMGEALAESFATADEHTNREYTTARLWGVADTAPYMHDGRASTLGEAIEMHGGEAQDSRDQFVALPADARQDLLGFLGSLRTPESPARDLVNRLD